MLKDPSFKIPILFLTYKRPAISKKVFNEIKKVRPYTLYLSSDGPKNNKEAAIISKLREDLLSQIDWKCSITTIFNDENLGCRKAVSSAINKLFEKEDMGIVLEDDCLPGKHFFNYCEELLIRYEHDERIYSISGFNQQNIWKSEECDYFFSKLGNCWGWATWKRCWREYDVDIPDFHIFDAQNGFINSLGKELGEIKRNMIFEGAVQKKSDTWAMQWGYLRHQKNGLTCIPSRSLIKNIGFGDDATHTFRDDFQNVERNTASFPLRINNYFVPDFEYDSLMFQKRGILERVFNRIKRSIQ